MKASELRIGNRIRDTDDHSEIHQIEEINKDGFTAGPLTVYRAGLEEEFNYGIPLTEEWLLKFGFNTTYADRCFKKKLSDTQHSMYITFTTDNPILTIGDAYTTKEYLSVFTKNLVQHVHQLQNLYFALTGEELEIKNT